MTVHFQIIDAFFFPQFQLDDWVLCRIYNKKGVIEKDYNNDQKPTKPTMSSSIPQYSDFEDQKPVIMGAQQMGHMGFSVPSPMAPSKNDQLHFGTSDSVPHCHTDTSGSNHAASPDFKCDNEVESHPKSNDFPPSYGFMGAFSNDPFATPSPFLQDHIITSFLDMVMLFR